MIFDPNDPAHPDNPYQSSRKGMRENTRKLIEITGCTDHNGVAHAPVDLNAVTEHDTQRLAAAVNKVATSLGVDVNGLFDSKSFISRVATLAPEDSNGITTAVKSAVKINPQLAAPQRPTAKSSQQDVLGYFKSIF